MRIRFNMSALRPVRFLIAACVCALLLLSNAIPVSADPVNPTSSTSSPQQGEANLQSIEKEAQKAVLKDPYSQKETKDKANQGLNEIQGAADIDQMSRPENSQDAISVEDKSKNFLEAITGRKDKN
ncbi:MAG: low temperature-induced protein [Chroococcus sp. CMT-3BRIN-NPC107]|jgi:hypothetical protein|nr:low temperature-induced protein [Chroococcus sp. CMT-3BRIN-NPC107]